MTDKKLIEVLDKILARKTGYDNRYPYNVGYYDGIKQTYDCYCLVKAIAWSDGTCADFWRVGQYAIYNPSSGMGDWTGGQILAHCTDVSSDMSNIQPGEFLFYEGGGHAGIYYGDRKVAEATPWKKNCVFLTDIGPNGERTYEGDRYGRWAQHGKLPFVEYSEPYSKYNVGDMVTIIQGAKVYGTDIYFASWVYGIPLTVSEQKGDRVVVNNGDYCIGAVSANDLLPYVPEIKPDPPEEDDLDKEVGWFSKFVIVFIKGLLNAVLDIFKKESNDA